MRVLIVLTLLGLVGCRLEPIQETVFTRRGPAAVRPDVGPVTNLPGVDGGVPTQGFGKSALLGEIAGCATELIADFGARAKALRDATSAWAAAPSEASHLAAQAAWREAMRTWQELELFRFGPAAPTTMRGGLGLRDQIYAWPLVSACKIDEQLISQAYAEPGFEDSLINARGLGALERLLFSASETNACSEFSVINASGSWAALPAEARAERRRAYAAAVATAIATRAAELQRAWGPEAGDFKGQLERAGSGLFASPQAALNAVSDSLFGLEVEVRDLKLARPLGLLDCAAPPCSALVESPWAGASTEHLLANLRGFQRLYAGCSTGLGFDDWLAAAGAVELSDRMTAALAEALARTEALGKPLDVALREDPAAVSNLYALLKTLTDAMKIELASVLDLELPMTVEGDND